MSKFAEAANIEYRAIFKTQWSPYFGAVLLAIINFWLVINHYFWGVFGGIRNWGDWINVGLGLDILLEIKVEQLISPGLHPISILNICLILGALYAALMSGNFRFQLPSAQDMITAIVGGLLMGIGATLAMGCNIGGFYTPASAFSLSGWIMMLGLMFGAFLGTKSILWIMENISIGNRHRVFTFLHQQKIIRLFPFFGMIILIAVIYWATRWAFSEQEKLTGRVILIACGFAIGIILQRSRFCFARCFREPFVTGDTSMTKAVMLTIILTMLSYSFIFQKELIDPFIAIPPNFWLGALLGGIIFGLGMILAGGCASGSLWRLAEGNMKLAIAIFFFAWSGSTCYALMKKSGFLEREMNLDLLEKTSLGVQSYLPQLTDSWLVTYCYTFSILILWYLFVKYNEISKRFVLL